MAGSGRHTNRLAQESSPYLLQHAHNPVDWYPWGPEAFAEARASGRLILLSVGYSACHWCHVMERECFEDAGIAAQMNEHFVNVKVDREERPDVDHVYMQVVQAMTGHGGWPMTVFLTPEGVPIFGGTYFPPDDRRGMPGFPRVMGAVRQTFAERGESVVGNGRELLERIRAEAAPRGADAVLSGAIAAEAAATLARQFDPRYGGMDRAPKFPQPMTWEALLRHWARTGDEQAAEMVRTTLVRMARGGIYDQVGGGFHRYSTDGRWLVPHFEKMLYDNGQLARLYLDGWRAFGDAELRRVCEQTLDYVARELRDPAGGFYSATDADSEGEEGRFFVWTPEEVAAVLGEGPVGEAAAALWDLGARPNFEGAWILHVPRDPAEIAARLGVDRETLDARIGEARQALYARRAERVPPGLDDKVLASWNGLVCRAFAEAGAALGRPDYVAIAEANVRFVLSAMRREDGRLLRTWKAGAAKIPAFLEDYANTVDALLAVYGATLDGWYAEEARKLADAMIDLFWDDGAGGFFDTGRDAEALVVRPRDFFDNAAPCGGSVAAEVLVRLATLTGEGRYRALAERGLRSTAALMGRYPGGFGRWLCALDQYLGPDLEVALVWPPGGLEGGGVGELLGEVAGRYLPRAVVAGRVEGGEGPASPLLEGRGARGGAATAYVCVGAACLEPVLGAEALGAQLDGLPRG